MTQASGGETLLERESELSEISRLVGEAGAGRGRLLLIEGSPGIGKTRLLDAVRACAHERKMVVLSARASELDREFPFGVVRQLFEPLVAAADAPRRARLLAGAANLTAPILGAGPQPTGVQAAAGDPSLTHFHALYWLIANLADEAPATLVIDDTHWADSSSLRFLQFLLPRVDELPVLVVLATRSAEPGVHSRATDALATDPLAHVLRPALLSHDAVGALIESELGESSDPEFSDACHRATGGNPFLVRELLRELAADGVTPSAAQTALVRDLAPPAVTRAVLVRLARLGDEASALARAVAVLGDGTPLRRACVVAGLPGEHGGKLAAKLVAADILRAELPPEFAHPILRSVIYADMESAERSGAHRRAAALLDDEGETAEAIAVHLLATEPAGDPYVVATLRAAADSALARGAAPTAVACLRRALSEPPSANERGLVVLELASAEFKSGEPSAAVDHFDEGNRITADPRSRAVRAVENAVALQAVGRDDAAFAVRERAAADVAATDPDLALSIEGTLVGTARWDLTRIEWAREWSERHQEAFATPERPAEWRLLAAQAHLDAFSSTSSEPAERLADIAEQALASLIRTDLPRGFASTGFFAAIEVLLLADRLDPARRAMDQAVDGLRRSGSAPGFAFTSAWRCLLLAREGALVDAEADACSCVDLSLSQGWFSAAPMTLGFALDLFVDRGQLDDANRVLEASGMAERTADHRLTFDPVVHARARMRAAGGDLNRARSDLASLRRRRARWNTYPTLVPPVLVAPALIADDPDHARECAARALNEAHGWGTPRAIGMALRAVGLVDGGACGLEALDEATRVLKTSPARLEYARALADFGGALRRANRRVAARDPLRRALDLADACGAAPLAELARHELRAAGGRPRRPRISGVHALTASERRVATMAVEGLSNPEIAQALFITKRTVETHLGNAYRKLDIQSRTQLAKALQDQEGEEP